jgi:hypothetical protein
VQGDLISNIFKWLNANQGVVSVLIFLLALFFGWASGIFASLRRKPKLRLQLIEGPTFCSTFLTGEKKNDFDVHRTAIALYLDVANVGSAPTSIEGVSIGYHWHLRPFSLNWLRYRVRWFWLHNQIAALEDFHVSIGDKIKVYPFLFQGNVMSPANAETYLGIGQSVHGVVYFEQADSWGGFFPTPRRGQTRIIVSVTDAFGTRHKKRFWIPVVTPDEAIKYNPRFGDTLPALRRGPIPAASSEGTPPSDEREGT